MREGGDLRAGSVGEIEFKTDIEDSAGRNEVGNLGPVRKRWGETAQHVEQAGVGHRPQTTARLTDSVLRQGAG